MLSVDEALEVVRREAKPLASEEVALADALGRVLAQDVAADRDLPAFDRSAMDGYALRAADVADAPRALELVGEVRAGQAASFELGPGQAAKILTGAPLPSGATAVQQVEKTRPLDEFRVTILARVDERQNVAPRGSEVRKGERVLERGRLVDASAIAVLAATGHASVAVARRPRAAVLVTGDEIVDFAAAPGPSQVRNSNGPAIAALARLAGASVRVVGIAPDRPDATLDALRDGFEGADVLLVSGGVSAGDYDLVEPALAELGTTFFFTGVAMKPGAPLVFGRRGDALVFGLPGNPVSAQVTFELFARAALLRLQGARVASRPRVSVELASTFRNRSGRACHVPARVRLEDGRLVARAVRSMGSGDLVAHARANALVVLEAARSEAAAGESAVALLLGRFLDDDGAPEEARA